MNPASLYFYATPSGEQRGPVPLETLRGLVRNGTISPTSPIWCEGWPEWRTVAACAQALAIPVAVRSVPYEPPAKPRRKLSALIPYAVALFFLVAFLFFIRERDPRAELYSRATEQVRAQLHAPLSASFTPFHSVVYEYNGRTMTMIGDVEFQNLYGVKLSRRWIAVFVEGKMQSAVLM